MKRALSVLLVMSLLFCPVYASELGDEAYIDTGEISDPSIFEETVPAMSAAGVDIGAPSAILIEKETGTVLYEKDADTVRAPASVTKIMTLLLIMEAIDAGTLKLDDTITTSAAAAGMGGSQIFLEEGEQMSLHEMLKSIVVSSANDASVAVAEHIAGTEGTFVQLMNDRAAALGCTNTTFLNCSGLPVEDQENSTTARDLSLIAQALLTHDLIKEYTTIWMDTVRNGEFGLSNTNKLIYYYDGATGLKTGFTQLAKYCLAASAQRDGVEYIAIIMGAETSDIRFESAKTLLSFAFANYTVVEAQPDDVLMPIPVELGTVDYVQPILGENSTVLMEKSEAANITKTVELDASVAAPVEAGQQIGTLTISGPDGELAKVPIVAGDDVAKITWGQVFGKFMTIIFTGGL